MSFNKILIIGLLIVFTYTMSNQAKADTLYCASPDRSPYENGSVTESLPNGVYKFKTKNIEVTFSYNYCVVVKEIKQ